MAKYKVIAEFISRGRRISPKDTREWTPPDEEVAERLVRAGCLRRLPGSTPEPNEITKEQGPEQGPETAAEAPVPPPAEAVGAAPKSKRTKRSRK